MTGTDATADAYAKKLVTHDGLTSADIPNDLSVRLAHNPTFAKDLEQALVRYQSGSAGGGVNQKEIAAILNQCTIYDGTHQPGSFKGQRIDLDKGGPDGANASNFIQVYSDGRSVGIHAVPDAKGAMTITGINTTEIDPKTQQVTNHRYRLSPGDPPGTLVQMGQDGNPLPNSPKLYDAHVDSGGQSGADSGVVVFRTGADANAPWAQLNPVTGKVEPHKDTPNEAATPGTGAPAPGAPGPDVVAPAPGAPGPDAGVPAPGAPGPDAGVPAPGAPGPDAGAPAPFDPYRFSGPAAQGPESGAPAPGLAGKR